MERSLHAQVKTDAVPLALVVHFLNVLAMGTLSLEERIQNTLLETRFWRRSQPQRQPHRGAAGGAGYPNLPPNGKQVPTFRRITDNKKAVCPRAYRFCSVCGITDGPASIPSC